MDTLWIIGGIAAAGVGLVMLIEWLARMRANAVKKTESGSSTGGDSGSGWFWGNGSDSDGGGDGGGD